MSDAARWMKRLCDGRLRMRPDSCASKQVNRLTRELSLLRAAQNASVVSNASSTSASGAPDTGNAATTSLPGFLPGTAADPPYSMGSSGFMIQYPNAGSGPVPPRRHHRTGSNASARSVASSTFANTGSANTGIPSSRGGSVAQTGGNTAMGGVSLSRQNSSASTRARTSRAASPSPHLMPSDPATIPGYFYAYGPREPPQQSQRSSSQQQQPHQYYSGAAAAHHPQTPSTAGGQHPSEPILSPGLVPATSRYEETALHRMELEAVRRENEALRRRVRELERRLRERRASDASVASSVSVSASGMTPSASGVSGAAIAGNSTGTPGAGSGGVGGSITAPRAGRERAAGITGSSPPSAGLPPGSNAFPSGSTASPVAAAVSTAGPAAVHAGSAVFVPSVGHVIPTSVATGSAPPAAAATATASPVASTPGLPSVPSTTSLAVGVPDDEVQVGESAASAGLGLGGTPTGGDNKSAPEQDGRSQQQQQSHHPVSSSGGVADVGS